MWALKSSVREKIHAREHTVRYSFIPIERTQYTRFLHNVEEKVESESSKVVRKLNMLSSQEPVE